MAEDEDEGEGDDEALLAVVDNDKEEDARGRALSSEMDASK